MGTTLVFWEQRHPVICGLIISAATYWLNLSTKIEIADKLSNPILSILAIAVGFIAAALTILLTVSDLNTLNIFRTNTALYNRFIDFHWEAIVSGMVSAVLSLVVIVACKKLETRPQELLFHVWLLSTVWSFASFFRVVKLLRSLLKA